MGRSVNGDENEFVLGRKRRNGIAVERQTGFALQILFDGQWRWEVAKRALGVELKNNIGSVAAEAIFARYFSRVNGGCGNAGLISG